MTCMFFARLAKAVKDGRQNIINVLKNYIPLKRSGKKKKAYEERAVMKKSNSIADVLLPLDTYMKDGSLRRLMELQERQAVTPILECEPYEAAVQCVDPSIDAKPVAKLVLKSLKKAAFNKNVAWYTSNARLFHPFIQCIVSIPMPLKHFIRTEISTTATTVFLTMKKQKNQQRLRCAAAPLVEISQKESLSSTLRQHSFPVSLEPVAVASTPYTHLSKVFVCPNCTKYYLKGSSPVVMFCSLDCKDESMKKPKMWRSKRCEIQKNLLSEAKASGLSKSFLQWPYQRKDVHIAAVKRSRI